MYWRLWGDCHFLYCGACHNYFPVYQMQWCCHHPEPPQFFTMEHQPTMTYPTGRFPCCGERAYRFEVLRNKSVSVIIILNQGCRHFPNIFESIKWLYVHQTQLTSHFWGTYNWLIVFIFQHNGMNHLKTVGGTLQNSRDQKSDMKQVPFRRPKNVRCHSKVASGICAHLI